MQKIEPKSNKDPTWLVATLKKIQKNTKDNAPYLTTFKTFFVFKKFRFGIFFIYFFIDLSTNKNSKVFFY